MRKFILVAIDAVLEECAFYCIDCRLSSTFMCQPAFWSTCLHAVVGLSLRAEEPIKNRSKISTRQFSSLFSRVDSTTIIGDWQPFIYFYICFNFTRYFTFPILKQSSTLVDVNALCSEKMKTELL